MVSLEGNINIFLLFLAVRNFAARAIGHIMCVNNGINLFNVDGKLDVDDWVQFTSLPGLFYQGRYAYLKLNLK